MQQFAERAGVRLWNQLRGERFVDRVEVGDIVLHNVAAVVFPDQTLGQNLLGMSFLSRVRWQQENGRLVLEQ